MNEQYYFNIDAQLIDEYKERYGQALDADVVKYCINHNEENLEKEKINRERTAAHNRSQSQHSGAVMSFLTVPVLEKLKEIANNHEEISEKTRTEKAIALGLAFNEVLTTRDITANKAFDNIFIDSFISRSSFNNYVGPEHCETKRDKNTILAIGIGLRATNEEMEKLLNSYGYTYGETGLDGLVRLFFDKKLPPKESLQILEALGLNPTEDEYKAVMFED